MEKENRVFFYLEYHKRDISRQFIRNAYKTSFESSDEKGSSFKRQPTPDGTNMHIDQVAIAYSRHKNLQDNLVPSKLYETDSCNAAAILQKIKSMRTLNGQAP